jgi:hypothetical protein
MVPLGHAVVLLALVSVIAGCGTNESSVARPDLAATVADLAGYDFAEEDCMAVCVPGKHCNAHVLVQGGVSCCRCIASAPPTWDCSLDGYCPPQDLATQDSD